MSLASSWTPASRRTPSPAEGREGRAISRKPGAGQDVQDTLGVPRWVSGRSDLAERILRRLDCGLPEPDSAETDGVRPPLGTPKQRPCSLYWPLAQTLRWRRTCEPPAVKTLSPQPLNPAVVYSRSRAINPWRGRCVCSPGSSCSQGTVRGEQTALPPLPFLPRKRILWRHSDCAERGRSGRLWYPETGGLYSSQRVPLVGSDDARGFCGATAPSLRRGR
jgi:hypothetical protein